MKTIAKDGINGVLDEKRKKSDKLFVYAILIFAVVCFMSWVGHSYVQACMFNQVTGKNVTTLQAMFLDLRVIE